MVEPVKVVFNDKEISIKVCLWKRGDPVPVFGEAVGVDTETELITDCELTPPLVVLGVYNPEDSTCYCVHWEDAQVFMHELLIRDLTLFFANVGFDYFELESNELRQAVTEGRVIDLLVRAPLREVATIGFIRTYSLVDACKNYLRYEMDKHEDQGDEAARVTFRRNKEVTIDQYQYLAIDCASTYYAAMEAGPQATEVTHTKGAIVLYHITKNGMPYDIKVWEYAEKLLKSSMDKYREELLTYGFPDPYKKDAPSELESLSSNWYPFFKTWLRCHVRENYAVLKGLPPKITIKRMLLYGSQLLQQGSDRAYIARVLTALVLQDKGALSKAEKAAWDALCDEVDFLDACDACKKKEVWPGILMCWMRAETETIDETHTERTPNYTDIGYVWQKVDDYVQEHQHWFTKDEPIKPKAFIQQKLQQLEADYAGLSFDKTLKTKELKCSKKDVWKLADAGAKDPFLTAYVNFTHAQKYMSAFVDRKYMRSDGRVRCRYGLVSTGRTSASGPNLQQYPSHDHEFPLKNMYKPPEGTIFLATDYSFAELVALAEYCYTRFGYSVLADVINADVCPHYFFAGVMKGLIEADTSFCKDPAEVARVKAYLKKHVTKDERQRAKAVNFGLPGKMMARRLYRHLRESGIKVTLEEASELRNVWLYTFSEMQQHFAKVPMKNDPYARYGINEDAEDDLDDDPMKDKRKDRKLYEVTTITGFKRSRAVENAAMNTEFQNPVAHLAKEALWNLELAGLGPRLLNFCHDEVDYWAYPSEIKQLVPIVEKLWLEPGKRVFPHVMLKCETSLSLYWDKGGVEFSELEWDANGEPILEMPEFVKKAYESAQ